MTATTRQYFAGPFVLAALAALLGGCSEGKTVVEYSVTKTESASDAAATGEQRAAAGSTAEEAAIRWEAPPGWRESAGSQMRMASFAAPTEAGEADVSLVKLSGAAGGLLANVNRWLGQIALRPVDEAGLAKLLEERRSRQGELYHFVRLNNSEIGRAIYGGVFRRGGYTLFAKLTAPSEAARLAEEDFLAFCDSVRFETDIAAVRPQP